MNATVRKRKLERAQERYELIDAAVKALLESGVKSYSIGSRSLTRLDLPALLKELQELEDLIDALEGNLTGRFRRVIPVDR